MNSRPNFVPEAGCPNSGSWDPVKGACISLERLQKAPLQSDVAKGPGMNDPKSGSSSNRPNTGYLVNQSSVLLVLALLMMMNNL